MAVAVAAVLQARPTSMSAVLQDWAAAVPAATMVRALEGVSLRLARTERLTPAVAVVVAGPITRRVPQAVPEVAAS